MKRSLAERLGRIVDTDELTGPPQKGESSGATHRSHVHTNQKECLFFFLLFLFFHPSSSASYQKYLQSKWIHWNQPVRV